jgi:hypothetical protein
MAERNDNIIKNTATSLEELFDQYKTFKGLTLDEVVKILNSQGIKPENTLKNIYFLEKNMRLRLINPYYPNSFFKYLLYAYSLFFWGQFLFIVFFYFITYYSESVYPIIFIKYVSSFIFILFIPGYALLNAIYYKKDEIEGVKKISLIVVTSITITAIVGIILNFLPWGVDSYLYFFTISILFIILNIYGLYKKYEYYSILEMR